MDLSLRMISALVLIIFSFVHGSKASLLSHSDLPNKLGWRSKSMKFANKIFQEKTFDEGAAKSTLLTPSTNCTGTFNGTSAKYEKCLSLYGGLEFLWNISSKGDKNANVSIIFTGSFGDHWVGFGPSLEGEMVGDSAIISRPGANGTVAKQYYLGGKSPSEVVPGGKLTVYNLESELVNGTMTVRFTLTLSIEQVNKYLFIWANGTYNEADGDTLQAHKVPYVGLISLSGNTTSASFRPSDGFRSLIYCTLSLLMLFLVW